MPALIVIPARGGSKGIPRKNLRRLAGQPLLTYSIAAALGAQCRGRVVVSTDDDEIARLAETHGAEVLRRTAELARDDVPLDPVVIDATRRVDGDFDAVITVQPTSPFTTAADIDAIYARLHATGANTAFTVADDTHLAWGTENGTLVPLYDARVNRQLLPRRLRETGAIVCVRTDVMLTSGTRFVPPFAVAELDAARSLDIDSRTDWACAEAMMALRTITVVVSGPDRMTRQLAIAAGLTKHAIRFVVSDDDQQAGALAAARFFDVVTVPSLDVESVWPHVGEVVMFDVARPDDALAQQLRTSGLAIVAIDPLSTIDDALNVSAFDPIPSELDRVMPRLTTFVESSQRRAIS